MCVGEWALLVAGSEQESGTAQVMTGQVTRQVKVERLGSQRGASHRTVAGQGS